MLEDVLASARTPAGKRISAVLLVAATLSVAVLGALLTNDAASGLNLAVERLSSQSSGTIGDFGVFLPLGFAFAAGMVSSVNPCGFTLLPAYLGLFLGEHDAGERPRLAPRIGRALAVGATVSLGFVLLFTVTGLAIGLGARAVVDWLPWIALGLGVALVAAGGYRLAGGSLYSAAPERLGAAVPVGEPRTTGYFLFGLSYGLASLSCTLPIFLVVVGSSITTATVWSSLGSLILYGLGMASVVMALTLATGVFQSALAIRLRRVLPYVEPIGTIALFVAGAYIVYYWLTIGGLLD
jgi:cytochrome c-type biogenesis protein